MHGLLDFTKRVGLIGYYYGFESHFRFGERAPSHYEVVQGELPQDNVAGVFCVGLPVLSCLRLRSFRQDR
jgi:hypothetical protein